MYNICNMLPSVRLLWIVYTSATNMKFWQCVQQTRHFLSDFQTFVTGKPVFVFFQDTKQSVSNPSPDSVSPCWRSQKNKYIYAA